MTSRSILQANLLHTASQLSPVIFPLRKSFASGCQTYNRASTRWVYLRICAAPNPPHVLQYTPRDLALIPVLPADAGEGPKEIRVALRATYEHDNAIKLAMKTEWSRDQQQKVASVILESMRHTAVSRFECLRHKHQQLDNAGDVIDNAYNGIAMAKELVAELAAGVVDEDDAEDHQDKINEMISTRLAAGCSLKEFSDKVTLARVKHNPFLERPYKASQLSRLYQQFLPENLSIDARNIRRSLEADGSWIDPDATLRVFMQLVKQVHKSDIHAAAAAAATTAAAVAAAAIVAAAASAGRSATVPGKSAGGAGRGSAGRSSSAAGRTGAGRGRGRGGPGRGSAPAAPASADSSKPKSPYILPGGKWCSSQTCHLDHDTRRPGTTCYRKSDVSVEVPQRVWDSPGYLAALDADRLANHQYHKLPGQPKPLRGPGGTTVRPALAHANANLCDPCVDEWGFAIYAALDESADDNGGAMSFMFDMGSPDYSSSPQHLDPHYAQLAMDEAEACGGEHDISRFEDGERYSTPTTRVNRAAGYWYAITGGEHEGVWFVSDYDRDITAFVQGVAGVRVYGPNEAVHSKSDALARVAAHRNARAAATPIVAAAFTPIVAAAFAPATPVSSATAPLITTPSMQTDRDARTVVHFSTQY